MPGGGDPGAPSGQTAPGGPAVRREARLSDLPDPRLLGRWRLFRADPSLDFAPNVRMEFLEGGRLRYSFDAGESPQFVMLVYRVEDDVLTTDNPAASHVVSARFWFGEGDVLAMDFAGAIAWFLREL